MDLTRRALLIGASSFALMTFMFSATNDGGLPFGPASYASVVPSGDGAIVGTFEVDGRSTSAMSVFLPVTGDDNRDATAYLEYRLAGGGAYTRGPDLYYIDPQYPTVNQQGFASGLINLPPDTAYDLRVVLADPDGTTGESATQILLAESTRAVPPLASAQGAADYTPTTEAALQSALSNASPGDVIEIPAGTTITLTQDLRYDQNGTEANPIFLRGANRLTSIIDCNANHRVWPAGDYLHIEGFTIRNSDAAHEALRVLGLSGSRAKTGQVVRGMYFTNIPGLAITAWQGQSDVLITNNVIEGTAAQGFDVGSGGARGIEVHGSSIEISYNTISGFVDGVVTSNQDEDNPGSVGVFVHHNEILWGTDDGIEADYTRRNGFIYYNSINNTPSAISFQPCIDGPCFAMYNLVNNFLRQPWKHKSATYSSYGSQVFHNTVIGGGRSWENTFTKSGNVSVVNNLYVAQSGLLQSPWNGHTVHLTSGPLTNLTMNHNAYYENKSFNVAPVSPAQSGANLEAFQAAGPLGDGSITLNGNPFPAVTLDWDAVPWTTCRDLLPGSAVAPSSTTNALNAAADMPYWNSNDGTAAIGAVQRGGSFPTVGASWHTADACP